MFLHSLTKRIVVLGCFMSAALCIASAHPFFVLGKDGIIAEYGGKQKSSIPGIKKVYPVRVHNGGYMLQERLYAASVHSVQFKKNGYLEVQLSDGRKDWILIG
jgi:hypothetical protein